MKDTMEKKEDKNQNKKKMQRIVIITLIAILSVTLIVITSLYIANEEFRYFFDRYVFQKVVTEETANILDINIEESGSIYAYDRYITILNKNILTTYTSPTKEDSRLELKISTPIYDSNNRYLAIAQKNGQKLYLISGDTILWQADIEGEITKIHVNKNGYVSVIVSQTSHKTSIVTYDNKGEELFRTFLAATSAIDVSISNDNRYLAIAEIDTSGTLIQSNIKVVSIDSSKIIYTYNAQPNELITGIKYQDKNRLVCMYDNAIHMIEEEQDTKLSELEDNKILFYDIELNNSILKVIEKSTSIFNANSQLQVTNINSKRESIYTIDAIPKMVIANNNVIALNIGAEVHFVGTNGWLIKKYTSKQEIKNIVLGDSLAGIIYKDKIEFINL